MLTLKLKTENSAFADADLGPELARILRGLATRLTNADGADDNGLLFDLNGNAAGHWVLR
jgi:hypothetical protein